MSFFHYSSSSCIDLSSGCWVFPVSLRGLQQVPSEWCCWRTCPTQTSWRGHTCIEAISSGSRRWFYVTISPSKCWKTHVSVRIWGKKIMINIDKPWNSALSPILRQDFCCMDASKPMPRGQVPKQCMFGMTTGEQIVINWWVQPVWSTLVGWDNHRSEQGINNVWNRQSKSMFKFTCPAGNASLSSQRLRHDHELFRSRDLGVDRDQYFVYSNPGSTLLCWRMLTASNV